MSKEEVFRKVYALIKKYEDNFKVTTDAEGRYELWTKEPVSINGRKPQDIYFLGLITQGKYVGFYYMPIYTDTEQKEFFEPELLKCLKGKSCFHLKEIDDKILKQIDDALVRGVELYRKRGWID